LSIYGAFVAASVAGDCQPDHNNPPQKKRLLEKDIPINKMKETEVENNS
jgi:hypothetical protein